MAAGCASVTIETCNAIVINHRPLVLFLGDFMWSLDAQLRQLRSYHTVWTDSTVSILGPRRN